MMSMLQLQFLRVYLSTGNRHLPLPWKALKHQSIDELTKHPNLEYTLVYNGYFLDYYGMPHCQSYMLPEAPYIDITACKAAIPGSGDDEVTFTYTKDVAKFVRKLIESKDQWPTCSRIAGDVITFNQLVEVAEKVRGEYGASVATRLAHPIKVPNSTLFTTLSRTFEVERSRRFLPIFHSTRSSPKNSCSR